MNLIDWISCILPLVFGGLLIVHWRQAKGSFWETFGLTMDRKMLLEWLVGFVIGGLVMFAIFGFEWALNAIQIEGVANPGEDFWPWILFLIIAALLEEILSRSLFLGGLIILLKDRKWLAVGVSALFFGLAAGLRSSGGHFSGRASAPDTVGCDWVGCRGGALPDNFLRRPALDRPEPGLLFRPVRSDKKDRLA